MQKKIHIDIGGMSCIHCQNTIEKALNEAVGVKKAKVSYSKGTADIEFDDEKTNIKNLKRIIEKLDYKVLSAGEKSSNDVVSAIGYFAVILVLFYLLQSLGLLNRLAPDRLAETGMGYGMLFIIGLITSVHCVAMCGGIGLSQSILKKGDEKTLKNPLAYNLGRVCSYTLIGLVLGAVGGLLGGNMGLAVPYYVQGIIKLIAGVFMVIAGINMLGIFPWFRKLSLHMPAGVAKLIGAKNVSDRGPFVIGLLNGFMPCGPLQAMWLVVLASGSLFAGALSMFMFSLGTVPLMLGLGSFVSLLGKKFTGQVMRVGAVLVVVMGLAMMTQGGSLAGMTPAADAKSVASDNTAKLEETVSEDLPPEEAPSLEETAPTEDVQIVNSTLALGGYPEITVKVGTPVKWIIDVPEGSLNGCNAVMIVPDYGIQHTFNIGENVIEFTPTEPGLVRYSCWMGMVYGSINVVEG